MSSSITNDVDLSTSNLNLFPCVKSHCLFLATSPCLSHYRLRRYHTRMQPASKLAAVEQDAMRKSRLFEPLRGVIFVQFLSSNRRPRDISPRSVRVSRKYPVSGFSGCNAITSRSFCFYQRSVRPLSSPLHPLE